MKKLLVIPLVLILAAGTVQSLEASRSSHGSFGLGVQIGEPTGLTGKFWVGGNSAVDATVGWNLHNDWLEAQAGYLFNFPFPVNAGSLYGYAGVGGSIRIWGGDPGGLRLAGRIPFGIDFIYNPVSIYAELDPLIVVIPGTYLDIGGGLGFRFYF